MQKNSDVMLSGNDFHGSVAFRAQTVPRAGNLDESCRKNAKKSMTYINKSRSNFLVDGKCLKLFEECNVCLFTTCEEWKTLP